MTLVGVAVSVDSSAVASVVSTGVGVVSGDTLGDVPVARVAASGDSVGLGVVRSSGVAVASGSALGDATVTLGVSGDSAAVDTGCAVVTGKLVGSVDSMLGFDVNNCTATVSF